MEKRERTEGLKPFVLSFLFYGNGVRYKKICEVKK